jgi:hypothetical protein
MSETTTSKTLLDINQTILKWLKEKTGLESLTRPDIEKLEEDWRKLGENTKSKSLEQLYSEMKEAVTRHLTGIGMSKTQADEWVSPRWKDFIDRAEAIRKSPSMAVPKVKRERFGLVQFFIGFVIVGNILASYSANQQADERAASEEQKHIVLVQELKQEQEAKWKAEFDAYEKRHQREIEHSPAQDLPPWAVPPLNPPAQPQIARAAVPLPVAVEEEADEPVEVEVTNSSGTQTYATTLGQVYKAIPESRNEIEQQAKIDHGYDHPDPRSCVSTDCLSQHSNQRPLKQYTVDSEVGSVKITPK